VQKRGERLKRILLLVMLIACGVIAWIGIILGMDNFRAHARAISSGIVEMRVDFIGFKGVVAEFRGSLNPVLGNGSIEVEPEYLQLTASDGRGGYYGSQIVNFHMTDPKDFVITIAGGYGASLKRRIESGTDDRETVKFSGILRLKLKTGKFPVEVAYPVSSQCEVEL